MSLTDRMARIALALLVAVCVFGAPRSALATKQFIIFFHEGDRDRLDPKQWSVTSEGESVAASAAAAYQDYGGLILLIGSDQNVGSASDAFVRSRRRAEAVRDVLVTLGVPGAAITTKGCGFSNLIVNTPKGVSETQNRYVVFDFFSERSDLVRGAAVVCPSAARDAAADP